MPNDLETRVREALREQAELQPFVPRDARGTGRQARARLVRNGVGAALVGGLLLLGVIGALGSVLNAWGPRPETSPSVPTPTATIAAGRVLSIPGQFVPGGQALLRDRDVWLLGQQGGSPRLQRLTEDGHVTSILGWFPDHRSLLVARGAGGRAIDLVRVFLADTKQIVLMRGLKLGHRPSLSPDGSAVAFCGPDGPSILSLADGAQRTIAKMRGCREATWSPDGADLAVGRLDPRIDGKMSPIDVLVVAVDGSSVERVSGGLGYPHDLAWSPDGTSIAFETNLFSPGLFVADLSTGRGREIATGVELGRDIPEWLDVLPAWSRDGRSIYVRSSDGVSSVSVASGEIRPIATFRG